MSDAVQITAAAGSRDEAERIAAELVERRLAGCVQIVGPVRSFYRWKGAMESSEEWLCLIKTRRETYDRVEAAIGELHSYDCPEIIATPIVAGPADYLQWLADQVEEEE